MQLRSAASLADREGWTDGVRYRGFNIYDAKGLDLKSKTIWPIDGVWSARSLALLPTQRRKK